jgi:acetyl esterase/lipase
MTFRVASVVAANLVGVALESAAAPADMTARPDGTDFAPRVYVYGASPSQHAELRLPTADATRTRPKAGWPVVVVLHGGCWRAQHSRDYVADFAAGFQAEGYAVWTPEYRRLGEAGGGWPGTLNDVGDAVRLATPEGTDHFGVADTRSPAWPLVLAGVRELSE